MGATSGGNREFVPVLARCAMTIGLAGLFMEVHQDPDNAPSDGPNMLKLEDLQDLLKQLYDIDESTKGGFLMDKEVKRIYDAEINRQSQTIELIASENFASQAVKRLCGSEFTNKYAEGYP